MIVRWKSFVGVIVISVLNITAVRAEGDLIFRISLAKWPVSYAQEPVRLQAWVTNQTDHDVRIPVDLQSFVFPMAFKPPDYKPVYGVTVGVPSKATESVKLPPGGFYGCILEHGRGIGPHSAVVAGN
jgi:hypothetical protein